MKIGFVADSITTFDGEHDTTAAMMQAAAKRGHRIFIMEQTDLSSLQGIAYANVQEVTHIQLTANPWYQLKPQQHCALAEFDVLMMRKDPPFDMDYIYATYLLERAEQQGVLVVNKPQALRDANEKICITWFPHCITDTLVSCNPEQIKQFLQQHRDIIVKPLDNKGGASIFRLQQQDPNLNVVLELMTQQGKRQMMAQRYLPEIAQGDRRILLIDGEPVPYVMARFAQAGETRANISAGGYIRCMPISDRERWLCQQVGATLRSKGLLFVGLDVIGDYITEINVTSPMGIRELDAEFGLDIADSVWRAVEKYRHAV